MAEHQLINPFFWNEGPPWPGHDWKITVMGPEDKTHTFNVFLQVLASKSLYFSKYAFDEKEIYKETQNKEVVLDWSEMEIGTFEMVLKTFKSFVDLAYALIGCVSTGDDLEIPKHLLNHSFFKDHPLCAGWILEYFQCPHESLKESCKDLIMSVSFPALVDDKFKLQPLLGDHWMDSWVVDYVITNFHQLENHVELISVDLMDATVDAVFTVEGNRPLVQLFAAFLEHNKNDTSEPFKAVFTKMIEMCKLCSSVLPHRVQCTPKAAASFVLALLVILETESRLGLAGDVKKFMFKESTFNLTDLQHHITTLMAKVFPQARINHVCKHHSGLFHKLKGQLEKVPTVSIVFHIKLVLLAEEASSAHTAINKKSTDVGLWDILTDQNTQILVCVLCGVLLCGRALRKHVG